GSFRCRPALLAGAIYARLRRGGRGDRRASPAAGLSRSATPASPAELAPHWDAAGRPVEALSASVDAAREAAAIFGLAEARAHLERAPRLWYAVPDAEGRTGPARAEPSPWAAALPV